VRTMETGTTEVRSGVSMAREAGGALKQIVAGVELVKRMVHDIAEATNLQNEDVGSIRENIVEISALIDGTFQNTREGSAKADALVELAKNLDNAVKAFKLG